MAKSYREGRGGDRFDRAAKRNHKARRAEWNIDEDYDYRNERNDRNPKSSSRADKNEPTEV